MDTRKVVIVSWIIHCIIFSSLLKFLLKSFKIWAYHIPKQGLLDVLTIFMVRCLHSKDLKLSWILILAVFLSSALSSSSQPSWNPNRLDKNYFRWFKIQNNQDRNESSNPFCDCVIFNHLKWNDPLFSYKDQGMIET